MAPLAITQESRRLSPRIIVCGVEKVGKTTFAAGSRVQDGAVVEVGLNRPVILPVDGEEGADELPVAKFAAARTFAEVLADLEALATEPHDFQAVAVDSVSALEPLIHAATVADAAKPDVKTIEDFGYGKGYVLALDKWRALCERLDYLRKARGMACILIAHTVAKTVTSPDTEPYDAHVLDVHAKAAQMLLRWADLILFANVRTALRRDGKGPTAHVRAVNAEGERVLYTRKTAAHPGGGRGALGRLPDELPLDWAAFEQALSAVYGENATTP